MSFALQASTYRLESRLWLERPIADVWPFFADASNLELITPDFLRFEIVSPQPIEMKVGALIDYRLRLHGMPLGWRTEIAEWDPPHRFADTQVRGPYRYWYHRHLFLESEGGTECIDIVDYRLPFGALGRLGHALFVRRDVERIFQSRSAYLIGRFGGRVLAAESGTADLGSGAAVPAASDSGPRTKVLEKSVRVEPGQGKT